MDLHIQERFVISQSWWIATELVRRNTQLRVLEWHPGGGQYDALGLLDETDGKVLVSLNRRGGRIHILESSDSTPLEWAEVFASKPHTIVEKIERGAGLTPPARTPASGKAVLTYRVLTSVLAQMVNSKNMWDVRSAFVDTSGHGGGANESLFVYFPSVARQIEAVGRLTAVRDATAGFWSLNRNGVAVAVLDEWGLLHDKGLEATDLMQQYVANHRSLSATIGQSLGEILK